MFFQLVLVLLALFVFRIFIYPNFKHRELNKIPGPPKHWLFGTMKAAGSGPENLRNSLHFSKVYGGMTRQWRGPTHPIVSIYHPKQAQHILAYSHPKSGVYQLLNPWLGFGLLTSHGKMWERKRKMLTPAFHFNILKSYVPIFGEHTQVLVSRWKKDAEEGQFVDITENITLATLDIIGDCAFSYKINAQQNRSKKDNIFVRAIYGVTDLIYQRALRPWLWPDFIYYNTADGKLFKNYVNDIDTFIYKVIDSRTDAINTEAGRAEIEKKEKQDFLDILLLHKDENGEALPLKEIRDECNTFMFEGHDTTSMGLAWAFYLIATHPEAEKKLLEEIKEVIGDSPYPSYEQLQQLKYTEACVYEALRLYPSVPTIGRTTTEDIMIESGGTDYRIPKGSDVLVWPYIMHRQEDIWEDPEAFIPERHLGGKKKPSYALVPFSAGPRNCIGQKFALLEEKAIVSMVIRELKMEADPTQKIACDPALVSRPVGGLRMKIRKREDYKM